MGQEQESWRRGCGGPRARGMLAGEGALSGGRSRRKGPGGLGRGRRARRRRRRKGKRRRKEEKGKERGRGKKKKLDLVEVVDGMRRPGGCEHLEEFWPEAVREHGWVAPTHPRRKISKSPEDSRDPDLELESYKNWRSTGPHQRCERENHHKKLAPPKFRSNI